MLELMLLERLTSEEFMLRFPLPLAGVGGPGFEEETRVWSLLERLVLPVLEVLLFRLVSLALLASRLRNSLGVVVDRRFLGILDGCSSGLRFSSCSDG